jgi:hypothetical protein
MHGNAVRGKARQGMVRQGKARQGIFYMEICKYKLNGEKR